MSRNARCKDWIAVSVLAIWLLLHEAIRPVTRAIFAEVVLEWR
jgi:hypothetical protein